MAKLIASAAFVVLATAASADSGFTFELGPGVKYGPVYFGSSDYGWAPTGKFRFGDGPADPGLSLHGSFRFIGARLPADHPELAGLADVPIAVELGGGIGYEAPDYRVFLDLRQGFGGHTGQVVEAGGDLKLSFGDRVSMSLGPRALFATGPYFDAYFNVTPAEAAASGFAAYDAGAGLVSTGVHFEARYQIDPDWALIGTFDHDLLRGGAAASPIVQNGSARQTSVAVMVTRRLSF